jgi:hypothetical protein
LKIQQFYVFKIFSDRLRDYNYSIDRLTLDDVRKNGELVSLSNSEVIRTIQRVKSKKFSQFDLDNLLELRKELRRKKNSGNNRTRLAEVSKQIDETLFIPELAIIYFTDRRHYQNIYDGGGFCINNIRFVPFMSSAGMLRRNSALFIDERIKDEVSIILNNGRDESVLIAVAKFSAYHSLYSSSTLPVSFPRLAVVKDHIINTLRRVDWAEYQGVDRDPTVTEKEMNLECNSFDGQGLVSPSMAKTWSRDLGLDYIPSTFVIRSAFLKGMAVTFDFHEFAMEFNQTIFTDIYGNTIDVKDIDCIVSESMLKLYNAYPSTEIYVENCEKNNISFGISKFSPKESKKHCTSSYQFLQVLDLDDFQIEHLCKPTLDWIKGVSGGNIQDVLLYLLGDSEFSDGWFDHLDPFVQSILFDNGIIKDSYIVSRLENSLTKKKNDAMMGRLIFSGNYSPMISDPFYECVKIFNLDIPPLLNEHQQYSYFWNERGVDKVAAIRSPIVHSSEVNELNFMNNDDVKRWYKHITHGIVYPANGIGMDCQIHGGSDFDADECATINSKEIINGRIGGNPILYTTMKPEKILIARDTEYMVTEYCISQIKTSKVGFLTNVSSALYSLRDNFIKGSPAYEAIEQRLKYGRAAQGLEIDRTKGLIVPDFPDHFVKWKKITDDMTDEEKAFWQFNNQIVANKRPKFFIRLYRHYAKRWRKEILKYDTYSKIRFERNFADMLNDDNLPHEQQELVNLYRERSFFLDNNSVMNRISRYVEKELKNVKLQLREGSKGFDYRLLTSSGFKVPAHNEIDKMQLLFKEFKALKRSIQDDSFVYSHEDYATLDQIIAHIKNRAYESISSNSAELADIAVYLCYAKLGKASKSFAWSCFGREIVQNIQDRVNVKSVRVPVPNPNGNIEYLWGKYTMSAINIET